jgi:hypothetical protein
VGSRPAEPNWVGIATAGLSGGLLAVLIIIALQASGLAPSPGGQAAIEEAQDLGADILAIERRVAALEAMNEGMPDVTRFNDLAGRVGSLEAARARTDSETEVIRSALAGLSERVTSAGAGSETGVEPSALSSLADRLSQAEATGKELGDRVARVEDRLAVLSAAPETQSERSALALAIGTLRRGAAESAPFASDLAMIAALGIAAEPVAALKPLAASGVPSMEQLTAGFPAVADAILSATDTIDPDAGILARIGSNLRGLVSVRPVGPIEGTDPAAIVSRMQAAVGAGNLRAALDEREALPEAGKQASADWAAAAERRVTVDELVGRIAEAVALPTAE